MKQALIITSIITLLSLSSSGQMFLTRNAKVSFISKAPVENIEAVNNEVTSVLNAAKGELGFVVLVKSFKFKKALQEEHFNENYLESNTYPKANFKGMITDMSKVSFDKDGTYAVNVKGELTIHGVTKSVETAGTIIVLGHSISAITKFNVKLRDYNVKVPSTVVNNVAEVVEISVDARYEPYKKP